jgi:hypothetical protein
MDEIYLSQVSSWTQSSDEISVCKAELNVTWVVDKRGQVIYVDFDDWKLR